VLREEFKTMTGKGFRPKEAVKDLAARYRLGTREVYALVHAEDGQHEA
jgi:hypothetical protein